MSDTSEAEAYVVRQATMTTEPKVTQDVIDLLPCPFCGGKPTIRHRVQEDGGACPRDFWHAIIECSDCDASPMGWESYGPMEPKDEADRTYINAQMAKKWNQRSRTQATEAEPIYQVFIGYRDISWKDIDKDSYENSWPNQTKRIVYLYPPKPAELPVQGEAVGYMLDHVPNRGYQQLVASKLFADNEMSKGFEHNGSFSQRPNCGKYPYDICVPLGPIASTPTLKPSVNELVEALEKIIARYESQKMTTAHAESLYRIAKEALITYRNDHAG